MKSAKNMDLNDLLSAIKSGNGADVAFGELVCRYMPLMRKRVFLYFNASGNTSEAMQEASIALHSAAMTYDAQKCGEVTFGLYAGVCIANRLKSLVKRNKRELSQIDRFVSAENQSEAADFELSVAMNDLCDRILKIASSILSAYEYKVFSLSFECYSTKDIAAALGKEPKSVDNAKNRIARRLGENKEIIAMLSDVK